MAAMNSVKFLNRCNKRQLDGEAALRRYVWDSYLEMFDCDPPRGWTIAQARNRVAYELELQEHLDSKGCLDDEFLERYDLATRGLPPSKNHMYATGKLERIKKKQRAVKAAEGIHVSDRIRRQAVQVLFKRFGGEEIYRPAHNEAHNGKILYYRAYSYYKRPRETIAAGAAAKFIAKGVCPLCLQKEPCECGGIDVDELLALIHRGKVGADVAIAILKSEGII